jgi:hypothetical protein
MEELYMSHWIEKIPGIKNFQRAGLTFLNSIRADMFDTLAGTLTVTETGAHSQQELEAIANFINVSTGRGNLGKAEQAAETLNTVFFAPKYVASRFQLILGQPAWKGTAMTRKLIAKEYARALIGMAAVYAIASLAGGDVEDDPRASDFGKIKFGKTRLDPMFGLSQTTVVLSRLLSGTTKSSSGRVSPISRWRGDIPFGGDTSWDVFSRFMRSKLSPLAGTTADLFVGENLIGEEVDLKTFPLKLITPLAYRDIYEALLENDVPKTTAFSILTFFGMGLQTYESKGISKLSETIGVNYPVLGNEIKRLLKADNEPTTVDFVKNSSSVKAFKEQKPEAKFNEAIAWGYAEYGKRAIRLLKTARYKRASDEGKKEQLNRVRTEVRARMLKRFGYRKKRSKGRRKFS